MQWKGTIHFIAQIGSTVFIIKCLTNNCVYMRWLWMICFISLYSLISLAWRCNANWKSHWKAENRQNEYTALCLYIDASRNFSVTDTEIIQFLNVSELRCRASFINIFYLVKELAYNSSHNLFNSLFLNING